MFETQYMLARAAAAQNTNEKELREKALMYAVQRLSKTSVEGNAVEVAEGYLKFLKGEAA